MSKTDVNVKKVDLVIVIDTSGSMQDEAQALSAAIDTAVKEASSSCPSDLRVDYLGIEGIFAKTKFDETVRAYLTKLGVDAAVLKSRKRNSLPDSGAQEDGARAVEDVSEHYDWRDGAERSIFLLQDESMDAGGMVVTPKVIQVNDKAIATAVQHGVKVHTYLGTPYYTSPYPSKADEENMIKEFKRLALRTGGEYYIYTTGIADFKVVLEEAICASKVPQDESIQDKKDEADALDSKTDDQDKEVKPSICDHLDEIIHTVNNLSEVLKELVNACKPHKEDCRCHKKESDNNIKEEPKTDTIPEEPKNPPAKPADPIAEKPVPEKPIPEKPVAAKPVPEAPKEKPKETKPVTPPAPIYTEIDQIYAITYYDNAFKGNQSDNGDIYVHNGGNGDRIRKAVDNQHGAGWSNATTSDGTHYFGWKANQIYRQKEGQKFEYLRGLSGGKGKDAFAFRKDDTGFFFSAIEGGKIYTFKHPQTSYSTVQVKGVSGNPHQPFGNGTGIIDIAFDADDRAYLMDSSGRTWRVDNTQGTTWEAKYLCQFVTAGEAGETCKYFGLAFDSHGGVYLAGGIQGSGGSKRFIAKSNFSSPDKVEKIYDGSWGSASYGNLSSRAYPKLP